MIRPYSIQNAEKLAEENISKNKLYLLMIGEETPEPVIDKETGLPIDTIGCEGGKAESKYVERYNQLIRKHVRSRKGPLH